MSKKNLLAALILTLSLSLESANASCTCWKAIQADGECYGRVEPFGSGDCGSACRHYIHKLYPYQPDWAIYGHAGDEYLARCNARSSTGNSKLLGPWPL